MLALRYFAGRTDVLTRILIINDETKILSVLNRALFDEPYQILAETSAELALKSMKQHLFKVVIFNGRIVGIQQSLQFFTKVQELHPEIIRIFLTDQANMETAIEAVNSRKIQCFFTTSWDDLDIKLAVRTAVAQYNLEARNKRLLSIARNQPLELKLLEKHYPGITHLTKDRQGSIVLPDMPEEEIELLIADYKKEPLSDLQLKDQ
jgi:two-component system, probable response regulator PhcQ